MQQVIPANGHVQHVGKFTLYITSDGQLLVTSGNMRVVASPEEARGMFDYLLLYAQRFQPATSNGNGNGHSSLIANG